MGVHDRTIVSKGRDFYDEDVPWQTAGTRPDIYSTFPPANSGWNRVPYGSIGR